MQNTAPYGTTLIPEVSRAKTQKTIMCLGGFRLFGKLITDELNAYRTAI